MWDHIKQNSIRKEIHIDFINGYSDHCHCLISMDSTQTIETIARLLKGESSFWANKIGLTEKRFSWQEEYYAASVDPRKLNVVRNYIKNQEEHHRKITSEEEYNKLVQDASRFA